MSQTRNHRAGRVAWTALFRNAFRRVRGEDAAMTGTPRSPQGRYVPKTTRVPVEGITSFTGISRWTAMIVLKPVQCMGMT